jgi:hypothetical protein
MKLGLRRFVLLCVMAASVIAVLVPGGSAGNRSADVTFVAFPGPTAVTSGKNIAYQTTLTNKSESMFTHATFRMRVPYVDLNPDDSVLDAEAETPPVVSNCPVNNGQGVTVPLSSGGHEWQCDIGNLPAGAPATLTVVWKAPTIPSQSGCDDCLQSEGSWTIKERKATNGNESFPSTGPISRLATLLGGEGTEETDQAGSYELSGCTGGNPNLSTNQDVDLSNPVATSFCLPAFQTSGANLGLATTIVEGLAQPGDPGVTGLRSDVCVADLGEDCSVDVPYSFGTDDPIRLVFRIADDALDNGEKITQVFHNGDPVPLPSCTSDHTIPTGEDDCVDSIQRSGGPVKIWTIVVLSDENGFYNW